MDLGAIGLIPNEAGYENTSQVLVCSVSVKDELRLELSRVYGSESILYVNLRDNDDWPEFSKRVRLFLKCPFSFEHSFQAFGECVGDLSWLKEGCFFLLIDSSALTHNSYYVFDAINSITNGIIKLNTKMALKFVTILLL